MPEFSIPAPEERLPLETYLAAKAWLLENDPDASRMIAWHQNDVRPPETAEEMAFEIIWIILCAGRSAQAARTIERKVLAAIEAGTPVVEAFGYRAKAAAIERAWSERFVDFEMLQKVIAAGDPEALVSWCKSIPFVGDDTQFQLAKNFGADVCKPDIWLCRLAGFPDKPRRALKIRFPACMRLCRALGQATGESIAMVDSMLWLACNKGVLVTDSDASPVSLNVKPGAARSIYESADEASEEKAAQQFSLNI